MFELSAGLYVLVGVSFLTSLMTAAIGVGGGIGLLAVMPQFLPISAVVPVHGLIQMVSNGSRFAFDYKHAKSRFSRVMSSAAFQGQPSVTSSLGISRKSTCR